MAVRPSARWRPPWFPLIPARALQGLGGGGLMTLAQATIADVVSPRERGRYAGYFSIVWGGSSVLGPMLGGIVTQRYGWPWIFWINLPLGIMALLVADRALRKLPVAHRRSPIDYAGILLLSGATVALLLILSLGGKRLPWTGLQSLALFAAAVILGGLFLRNQKRSPEPIVPPQFLQDSVIRPVLVTIFLIFGSYLALAVLTPIYFQVALGMSVSDAGLLMIPLGLASVLTANLAGQNTRKTGRYKRPPLIGMPIAIVVLAMVAFYADRLSAPGAAVALMVVGLGVGPIFPGHSGRSECRAARPARRRQRWRRLFTGPGRRHRRCRSLGAGTGPRRRRAHFGRTDHEPRRPGAHRPLAGSTTRSRPCVRRHVRRGRGGAGDRACGLRARRGSAARRALALGHRSRRGVNGRHWSSA
jgi:MFS family permease